MRRTPSAATSGSRWAWELRIASRAARTAGSLLLDYEEKALNARLKPDRTLVTDADLAAEVEILSRLRREFPNDHIDAEERGELGPDSGRQWIVDPLDGTTNFTHGLPFYAVSIALWEDGDPAVAVVYMPAVRELFAAARDTPATLNGRELRVSRTAALGEAMVNVYFDRRQRLAEGLEVHRRVALGCEGRVKTIGSTASLLCYVAAGRLDAYVRTTTKLWDFAAGGLILRQAGGRLTDFAGQPLVRTGQSLLATNGCFHDDLARVVQGAG